MENLEVSAATVALLAQGARSLISEISSIDLANTKQLLVLELAPDATSEQAEALQTMMKSLSQMSGLAGVIIGDGHKLIHVPICEDCPVHGPQCTCLQKL